jgi:succinate-semialdehyde dehydrogenase / glutarate-semialdehyde dehydrogenase
LEAAVQALRRARRRISDLVEDAVARGASVLSGGQIPEGVGCFYPATVLTDVPLRARIWNEEISGPVAPIRTFRGEADAAKYANDMVYGLVAYLYRRDLQRGLRFSE